MDLKVVNLHKIVPVPAKLERMVWVVQILQTVMAYAQQDPLVRKEQIQNIALSARLESIIH